MILLGVDYGTVRIGLAVLDTEVGFALPLRSVDGKAGERPAVAEVARIAKEERADCIVVGVPTLMSGEEGRMADAARAFAAALAAEGIPVDTEDERMTTALALKSMAEAGFKKGSLDKDAAAAALILESYWERNRSSLRGA